MMPRAAEPVAAHIASIQINPYLGNVYRHRLDLAVRLEIHDSPANEIRCILVKGEIYRALNQAAIISSEQNRSLTAESAFACAGCGSSQDWMRERRTDSGDGSLDFLLCRVHQPSISDCPGLYRIDTGIQID